MMCNRDPYFNRSLNSNTKSYAVKRLFIRGLFGISKDVTINLELMIQVWVLFNKEIHNILQAQY